MTTTTYTLSYDYTDLARVTIEDSERANAAIREMVEFWMGWENDLEAVEGDYTRCWLKKLTRFLVHHGELPEEFEGWARLDGSVGITVKVIRSWRWEIEDCLIDIEKENN